MYTVELEGCATKPLGSYLKALAVLRLVSEQADDEARGWWDGGRFHLASRFSPEDLAAFFLQEYRPTPVLAPWNGGSGFYAKDRKVGIDAIANSAGDRFVEYRTAIALLRQMPEIVAGKAEKNEEEERRTAILRAARNSLPDTTVEWLDAAVGLAADGKRSFAPILGTGGNEGRLDYTNNFMERLAGLLIAPEKKTPVLALLENALYGCSVEALQPASAGQFDPGRAGGFNQGQGIATPDIPVNPWDFVLTMEGAVAWASGIYRRQGVSYRSFLCSPFTVYASNVGYGSSAAGDEARAEIWAPVWRRPTRYAEVKALLREGRASVNERPAENGIEFAEAASSLGVDRGIAGFVRYNLLKRRGDSYVALPAGEFPVGYRSVADRIRELNVILDQFGKIPGGAEGLRRNVDVALYEALLRGGSERLRAVMVSIGRLLRWYGRTKEPLYVRGKLDAAQWIEACGPEKTEVRIAAAIASISDRAAGSLRNNLFASSDQFAWSGRDLPHRMMSVIEKRLLALAAAESEAKPFRANFEIHPGDTTLFIEGSVDDDLIEDLVFAFTLLNWSSRVNPATPECKEVLPAYAALKHLFLPGPVEANGEKVRLAPDRRILSLLRAGNTKDAVGIALHRLRVARLRPVKMECEGGLDATRLGASLLIPTYSGKILARAILHLMEEEG